LAANEGWTTLKYYFLPSFDKNKIFVATAWVKVMTSLMMTSYNGKFP